MERALHRKIKIISIISIILFTIPAYVLIIIYFPKNIDLGFSISGVWTGIIIFPLISILTSYTLIHKEKIWIRKVAKIVAYLYPVIFILSVVFLVAVENILIALPVIVIFVFASIFTLLHIFVFTDGTKITSNLLLFICILTSILLKKYHISFSGAFFFVFLFSLILGNIMYGIRCLYLVDKNPFLKYTGFLASWFIAFFLVGLLFKMMQWPGSYTLVNTSNVVFVLGSLYVLLRLPTCDYLNWQQFHKKIFKRVMLPWFLIFALFLMQYLTPELNKTVWSSSSRIDLQSPDNGFNMTDYTIEERNGLSQ